MAEKAEKGQRLAGSVEKSGQCGGLAGSLAGQNSPAISRTVRVAASSTSPVAATEHRTRSTWLQSQMPVQAPQVQK